MADLNKIIDGLNAKKQGKGWIACCPAHDDRNPSLSIDLDNDQVLLHCHAGCTNEDVLSALKIRDLWPNSKNKNQKILRPEINIEVQKAADALRNSSSMLTYLINERLWSESIINLLQIGLSDSKYLIPVYDDKNQLIDARLYDPKNKQQKMRPLVKGVTASLFPSVSFLSDEFDGRHGGVGLAHANPIVICEGEPDTIAMLSAGYLAITNTMGANTWNDEFSLQLSKARRKLIIALDNDDAGEAGRDKRITSLLKYCPEVYYIEWPASRPTAHDLTDELRTHGVKGIESLINNAKVRRNVISLNNVKPESVTFLFDPYIPISKVTIIEGDPGIGKSFFALYLAAILSKGLNLKNEAARQASTLILSAEDGLADTIAPRLQNMNPNMESIFVPAEPIDALDELGLASLRSTIISSKAKLVIIDTLVPHLPPGTDTNKSTDVRKVFKALGHIAEEAQCAILVVRHLNKKTDTASLYRGAGSIDIVASVRSVLQVTKDGQENFCRVRHIKSNLAPCGSDIGYRLIDSKVEICDLPINRTNEIKSRSPRRDEACSFLEKELATGAKSVKTLEECAKQLKISIETLRDAKKELEIIHFRVGHVTYWKLKPNALENLANKANLAT